MTVDKIARSLAKIATAFGADEQHRLEKKLWHDALKAIANGTPDAQAIAANALKSSKIKFPRWYA